MIGEPRNTVEDPSNNIAVKIALRDASIMAGITLFANLAAYGYPPTPQGIYATCLAAGITFFTSLAFYLKVQKPTKTETP